MEKIKKVVPYILFCLLLLVSLKTLNRVNELDHLIKRNNNEIGSISGRINSLRNTIQTDINDSKLLDTFDYEVVNTDGHRASVQLKVGLNKFAKDSKVFVSYEALPLEKRYEYDTIIDLKMDIPTDVTKVELHNIEDINFIGICQFNDKLQYKLKVIVESEGMIESSDLGVVDMYQLFYPQIVIDLHPSNMNSNGTVNYECVLNAYQLRDTKIQSAMCYLKYEGKVVDEFDLIKEGEAHNFDSEENIEYRFMRRAKVILEGGEMLSFDNVQLEMIVETDADIAFKKVWREY